MSAGPTLCPDPPPSSPTSIRPALDSRVLDRTPNKRGGPEPGPPGRAPSRLKASGRILFPLLDRSGQRLALHGGARWAPGLAAAPGLSLPPPFTCGRGEHLPNSLRSSTSLPTGLQAVRRAAGTR